MKERKMRFEFASRTMLRGGMDISIISPDVVIIADITTYVEKHHDAIEAIEFGTVPGDEGRRRLTFYYTDADRLAGLWIARAEREPGGPWLYTFPEFEPEPEES